MRAPLDKKLMLKALAAFAGVVTVRYVPPVTRPVRHRLITSVTGGGSLSMNPSPPTDLIGYVAGTRVYVSAEQESPAHTFEGWGGDCAGTRSTNTTCVLAMDGPKKVNARFKVTLTATAGANGRVSPAGVTAHSVGSSVSVEAFPAANHEVDSWSGACSGSGKSCSVAMSGDRSVNVSFKAKATPPPTATPPTVDPLVARFDTNGNGVIDKAEMYAAMNLYLYPEEHEGEDIPTKVEPYRLIDLYLFGE
ncbi:MAG: hypothetical protein OXE43_14385 [Chloroflexi bacterium]|nr:hypothetical protein [Chloroflexota bacterium]